MKILVLGGNGQLGRCLRDHLDNTTYEVIYTSREQINITNFEETKNKVVGIAPHLIINTAAYTAVDKAEENAEIANLVNNLAVNNIAQICSSLDIWLVHVSTDYVFDGLSEIPYKENDITNPQGVYGMTKLKGELAIQNSSCKHTIIRTSWVFSEYGNNFVKTMLRLGEDRDELRIVEDQFGSPTYAQDIARSIVEIVPQLNLQNTSGLYHYCGDRSCSWYTFATKIFEQAKAHNLRTPSVINPIETNAYSTNAKRPSFSVLDCSKIESEFGVRVSDWYGGLSQVICKI
tara:strand:+ start:363 stop:1229 length:867 start_codon:yes stop_codon:yes gene_type:complete